MAQRGVDRSKPDMTTIFDLRDQKVKTVRKKDLRQYRGNWREPTEAELKAAQPKR